MDEIVQTQYGQGQGGVKFTTVGQVQAAGQFGWGAKLDGQPTINFDGVMRPYSAHPYQLFDFLKPEQILLIHLDYLVVALTEVSGLQSQQQMLKVLRQTMDIRERFSM